MRLEANTPDAIVSRNSFPRSRPQGALSFS